MECMAQCVCMCVYTCVCTCVCVYALDIEYGMYRSVYVHVLRVCMRAIYVYVGRKYIPRV